MFAFQLQFQVFLHKEDIWKANFFKESQVLLALGLSASKKDQTLQNHGIDRKFVSPMTQHSYILEYNLLAQASQGQRVFPQNGPGYQEELQPFTQPHAKAFSCHPLHMENVGEPKQQIRQEKQKESNNDFHVSHKCTLAANPLASTAHQTIKGNFSNVFSEILMQCCSPGFHRKTHVFLLSCM